jgi:hypothetical protein
LALMGGTVTATAHPFYWAPFALIGEGRAAAAGNARAVEQSRIRIRG